MATGDGDDCYGPSHNSYIFVRHGIASPPSSLNTLSVGDLVAIGADGCGFNDPSTTVHIDPGIFSPTRQFAGSRQTPGGQCGQFATPGTILGILDRRLVYHCIDSPYGTRVWHAI